MGYSMEQPLLTQETQFNTGEFRRSRKAYTLECAFEYFVALMVEDSFLAKLLMQLGFSDAQTGLISSFISLAFLFQLLAVPIAQKIAHTKRFSVAVHAISQLLFTSLYLVPLLPFSAGMRRGVAIVCLLTAYLGNYLVAPMIFRGANGFVHPRKRALFSANKEMLSLVSGVVITLVMGYAMDFFESEDRLGDGFTFIALAMCIFSFCDFLCLLLIKRETLPSAPREKRQPTAQVVKMLFGKSSFREIVLLEMLWKAAQYMSVGFLGTFKLNDLLFTVGQIQLFNLLGCMGRFALSRFFGRYSDKHTFAGGIELALLVAGAAFAANAFTAPATRWLIVANTLLYNISLAGMAGNLQNITLSYVDRQYYVQANSLKNSIGGLFGFGASLVGSGILASVQAAGNQVLGMPIYCQQILGMISVLLVLLAFCLTHFVIRRQQVMLQ